MFEWVKNKKFADALNQGVNFIRETAQRRGLGVTSDTTTENATDDIAQANSQSVAPTMTSPDAGYARVNQSVDSQTTTNTTSFSKGESEKVYDNALGGDVFHRQAGVDNSPRSKLGYDASGNNFDVDSNYLKDRGEESKVNPSTYHQTSGDDSRVSRSDQLH